MMLDKVKIDWYFDFVSPFAYLQLEQLSKLPPHIYLSVKPVVLGALLSHWGTKGPAEIPEKRRFTYRYAHFRAQELGIPFKMPEAHPFNPISLLRIAIALGSSVEVVREIFRFVWRDGRLFATGADWNDLVSRLGVTLTADEITSEAVKGKLRANTDEAIQRGVFGAPTAILDGDLFWGEDSTRLLLRCLSDPDWLNSKEVTRISTLPVGVQRQTPR